MLASPFASTAPRRSCQDRQKSFFIWPEQGFGDYIQFVRYVPLLKARGLARLTLVCRSPLLSLLKTVAGVEDFADSAAIVSQLDLVICVDIVIAHLAGALAKPCWVLLTAMGTADWRWQWDRTDSPWYPSVRLFRQTALDDWSETVLQVAAALKTWVMLSQAQDEQ